MSAGVRLEAVSVRRGDAVVVDRVSLFVPRGAWFGLIGANGSGKTSLLRAVAGRLPIATGRCVVDGVDSAADRGERARLFGFAPPADRLADALRGRDVLELVGGRMADILPRLGPLRGALGLDALLDRWIGDCSAGMRQRLAVAVAFADGHTRVVLDEPFNWLDPVAVFDLRRAFRSMVDAGLTLVTALHDLSLLAASCDEGMMLADGKVALALDGPMLRQAADDPRGFERRFIDLLRPGKDTVGD